MKAVGILLTMTRYSHRYPDGVAGIALVLLRLGCAWIAFQGTARPRSLPFPPYVSIVASGALAIALLLGLGTRIVAFVSATAAIAVAFMTGGDVATMMARACGCAALGLLGPGAYSIDSNLFGRRVIRLEPRAPHRASDA